MEEEIIKAVRDLVEREEARLLEKVRKGSKHAVFDFKELSRDSPLLAEFLLDNPEQAMNVIETEIRNIHEPKNRLVPRFQNISGTATIQIRRLTADHRFLNKFVTVQGIVQAKHPPSPHVSSITFECKSCGNTTTLLQAESKIVKEPTRCSCGRTKFSMLETKKLSAFSLTLEEDPAEIEGSDTNLRRILVFCKEGLCDEDIEPRISAGTKVDITGIYKATFKTRGKHKLTELEIYIDANYIKIYDEDYTNIKIKPEDETAIKELSRDPFLMQKLINSTFPNISGYEKEKEAIILQQFGGTKLSKKGEHKRGDIHVLFIGDPSTAKSLMLQQAKLISPKCRATTGAGSSGVGLTASAIKDEILGGYTCAAGTIPLAHKGIAIIDEFDKMNEEDRNAMHQAMEQQIISVSKGNVQANLKAETAILAAANPKLGRFDQFQDLYPQFNLSPTLVSRFDLIFVFKDKPDKERDTIIADTVGLEYLEREETNPDISREFIKKYISYARKRIKPTVTQEVHEYLKKCYVSLRNRNVGNPNASIPITARELRTLYRLTTAYAKVRLKERAGIEEAKIAWELVYYTLEKIAMDKNTGMLDMDIISVGVSQSTRNRIVQFKEGFEEIMMNNQQATTEDVFNHFKNKGWTRTEIEEIINKLKNSGDMIEPKKGLLLQMIY